MANTIFYENLLIDINTNEDVLQISYVKCWPPARLTPKGTVVLLHDFFRTSYQFRHIIDLFAVAGYISIAPDLPGRPLWPGQLPRPDSSKEDLSNGLYQLLRALFTNQAVHIIGCGLGAQVACNLCTRWPETVASLIIDESTHILPTKKSLRDLLTVSTSSTMHQRLRVFKEHLAPGTSNTSCIHEEDVEEEAEAFLDPEKLSNMQELCKTALQDMHVTETCVSVVDTLDVRHMHITRRQDTSADSKHARVNCVTKQIDSDSGCESLPEDQPEHFAIAALSFINMQPRAGESHRDINGRPSLTKQARL